MANAKVDVLSQDDIPIVLDLYNRIYRPTHNAEFFRRRFLGRYNVLMLIATLDESPVGFFVGFELKPTVFFAWLYGVMPDVRRQGIASQLMDAAHAWAVAHQYSTIRFECHNQHRPMLQLAISKEYDILGIRWDPDRDDNLVIFEKTLVTDS